MQYIHVDGTTRNWIIRIYAISGLYMRFVSRQNQYVAIIHRNFFLMILVSREKITVTLLTRVSSWTHYFLAEVALVLGLDIRLILINELLQNNYRHAEKTFKVWNIMKAKNHSNNLWKGIFLWKICRCRVWYEGKLVIIHYENNRILREIICGQVYQ